MINKPVENPMQPIVISRLMPGGNKKVTHT